MARKISKKLRILQNCVPFDTIILAKIRTPNLFFFFITIEHIVKCFDIIEKKLFWSVILNNSKASCKMGFTWVKNWKYAKIFLSGLARSSTARKNYSNKSKSAQLWKIFDFWAQFEILLEILPPSESLGGSEKFNMKNRRFLLITSYQQNFIILAPTN